MEPSSTDFWEICGSKSYWVILRPSLIIMVLRLVLYLDFLVLIMGIVITLTIGYNRAVNPRRFRCMDSRCESKFPTSNGLLLLELTTIAVRM